MRRLLLPAGDRAWHAGVKNFSHSCITMPSDRAPISRSRADRSWRSASNSDLTIIASGRRSGMARWREELFAFMHHNAQRPGAYFKIPSGQIMEIGIEFRSDDYCFRPAIGHGTLA